MQLSDELFSDIRRGLGLEPAPAAEAENANPDRQKVNVEIEVETFAAAKTVRRTVTLTDFGRGGLCLLDLGPWGAGERLTVHLPAGQGRVVPIICTVRNSVLQGERFRVGAEFTAWCEVSFGGLVHSVDGLHALSPLPMPASSGSTGDRREPRKVLSAEARITPLAKAATPIEARVVDASSGGLGIVSAKPIAVDTKVMVEVLQPGQPPRRHPSTVVACREIGPSRHRIGLKFASIRGVVSGLMRLIRGT